MAYLSIEKLQRAGFSLESYEDGKFWVYEGTLGEDTGQLLATCRYCISNFDEYTLTDTLILQCNFDFKDPVLYLDGSLWHLSQRDFADVVRHLKKKKSKS